METLIFKSSIFIHVICGIIALITGLVAMVVKKGSKPHNLAGITFYWVMTIIFITTIIFFIIYPTNVRYHFFLMIGIVSFYPNWSGKRMLSMKKAINPTKLDIWAAYGIGISGIVMLVYGIYGFIQPKLVQGYQVLFVLFGILSLFNAYGDLKIYLGYQKPEKMHWFLAHAGKMIGAYTAAITAFCVNIVPRMLPQHRSFLIDLTVWVLPGVLLGIYTVRTIRKYRKKFNPTKTMKIA